jgi:hypothetical protein
MSAACPVFGVVVRVHPAPDVDLDRILIALRDAVLAPRALLASPGEGTGEHVITGDGFQATDADRQAIVDWLGRHQGIARYTVSAVGDVGHAA